MTQTKRCLGYVRSFDHLWDVSKHESTTDSSPEWTCLPKVSQLMDTSLRTTPWGHMSSRQSSETGLRQDRCWEQMGLFSFKRGNHHHGSPPIRVLQQDWADGSPPEPRPEPNPAALERPEHVQHFPPDLSLAYRWISMKISTWKQASRVIGETLKQKQANTVKPVCVEFKKTHNQKEKLGQKEDGSSKICSCLEYVVVWPSLAFCPGQF